MMFLTSLAWAGIIVCTFVICASMHEMWRAPSYLRNRMTLCWQPFVVIIVSVLWLIFGE